MRRLIRAAYLTSPGRHNGFTDYFRKPGELGWGPRAAPGTAVTVIWGRPGTSQREIRAVVTALPFKPDHRRVDVTAR